MEGKLLKQDINDCISNLENHVHGVFASVRAAGEDFVYCPSAELFSKLDDYCDELNLSEVRPPLLIKGEEGTGKSALLANWLQKREHNRSLGDEFLFWHAVGCSRPSLNVNHLLRRLISGLKVRFELARNIPRAQERLSWELPRFLDLASKKGKIVIVIDGIHQLRTNDGSEDNLAWLPLELPANVRMILSVTAAVEENKTAMNEEQPKSDALPTYTPFRHSTIEHVNNEFLADASKGKTRRNRILAELERRKIPFITVKPLDKTVARTLINTYIESTVSSDAAAVATSPYLGTFFDPTLNRATQPSTENTYGFLLFESQINQLVDHPLGGNPQFLRLFLKSLYFVCRRGYSLWSVFDDWILAENVTDLFTRILRSCETGFKRSRESSQRDCDLTIAAGGAAALKGLYPWHPVFKDKSTSSDDSVSGGNSVVDNGIDNNLHQKSTVAMTDPQQSSSTNVESDDIVGKENKTLSSLVIHNLGDQESVAVERLAHRKLQKAVIEVRKVVDEHWNPKDTSYKSKLIESAIQKIQTGSSHEELVLSEEQYNDLEARMRALSHDSLSTNSPQQPQFEGESHLEAGSDDEESWEEQSTLSAKNRSTLLDVSTHSIEGTMSPKPSHGHLPAHLSPLRTASPAPHDNSMADKNNPHGAKTNTAPVIPAVDPSEGFFSLPLYMRGGSNTSGFGDILGNALSLLYVARQGLKEQELWKILDYLQVKAKYQNEAAREKRRMLKEKKLMMRKHAESILKEQALIEVVLRSEDAGRTGYVSEEQLYVSVRKFVDLDRSDLITMLDLIASNVASHLLDSNEEKFLENDGFIHYGKFFVFLTKVDRKFHSRSSNSKFSEKNIALQEEEEGWKEQFDDDFENFQVKEVIDSELPHPSSHQSHGNTASLEEEQKKITSLGPVVEEMLLTELCALSVLYSPENKVLILPCDSDLFRQTIFDRYILPRGGGNIQYWHNLIIQYFRTQPNSLRKCEEMPWHLKICRKWTSLKDCLVDLKTFDLMFNNDLREELMEYWLLLTEGPLYVTDSPPVNNKPVVSYLRNSSSAAANSRNKGGGNGGLEEDNDDNRSTFSHVLREIDESIATKMPLKEIRKKMFQYQMQPFDVIEELNRSIENWVTTERPSPFLIHRTINQIASFLLEFAKQMRSCPQFRRLGIDMAVLEQFGIDLEELKAAMNFQNLLPASSGNTNSNNNTTAGGGATSGPGTAGNETSNEEAFSPHKTPGNPKGGSASPEVKKYFDGLQKKEAVKFPTPVMVSSNFYLYLRWIWIQFPWLALHLAATVHSPTLRSREGLLGESGNTSSNSNNNNEFFKMTSHGEIEGSEAEMLAAQGIHDPAKHLLRVWNVKKADPSVQVFSNSLNRKMAAIKPRSSLSSSLERNVAVTYKNLCEELQRPSHMAQLRLGLGYTNRDKFRRTFQEEVETTKNIPFAYHGVRAMKMQSLFPSYHSFIREKNRQHLDREVLLNGEEEEDEATGITGGGGSSGKDSPSRRRAGVVKKKKKLGKFDLDSALKKLTSATAGNSARYVSEGGEGGSTFFLTELDDEIRRLTSEEYLQSHRMDRGGLIKDELDLENATYLDRISRMKMIWNKLLIIEKEKERVITELENAIILRQESDTVLINEVQSGEALIKTLNERNIMMEKSLREAVVLEEGYKELIKALKLNPPYIESHVQSLEMEVALAEKQFQDLCNHRAKLYQESLKLEEVKKKALLERIQYFKTARQEIQMKKKSVQKEIKHLKDTLGKNLPFGAFTSTNGTTTTDSAGRRRKTQLQKVDTNDKTAKSRVQQLRHKTSRSRNRISPSNSDNENEIIDSSDSDSSDARSTSDLQLTKPVMHFINALVRKVTYNEPIIKETDATVHDVKKRAAIAAQNAMRQSQDEDDDDYGDDLNAPLPPTHQTSSNSNNTGGLPSRPGSVKRRGGGAGGGRRGSVTHYSSHNNHSSNKDTTTSNTGYDSESVGSLGSLNRISNNNNNHSNSHPSNSNNMTGGGGGNSRNTVAASQAMNLMNTANNPPRRRLTSEQISKLKNVVKLLFGNNSEGGGGSSSGGPRENLKSQIQKAVHLIFQKTESNTYEEFIERYLQDQVLLEQLKSQQVLVDSRLAQLRAEHAELYTVWSDISFLAEENNVSSAVLNNNNNNSNNPNPSNSNNGGVDADNTDRYLDNQLFVREVRMHHYQRLCENSIHTISEAKTAVAHLIRLLVINNKLLTNLPRSSPPALVTDADMAGCLSWCEDRLIALNEALTMDANRPAANASEENKPIAQRQTELAELIHQMSSDKRSARLNSSLKGQKKQQGALSKGLINAIDNNAFISSPRGVMIVPAGKIDKNYDSKVSKLISERDKYAEAIEGKNFFSRDVKASNEVQRFLNEGLDKAETKNMSRRAKQLINKRSGRTASYGLVLEELLQSRGQSFNFPGPATLSTNKTTAATTAVVAESTTPPPTSPTKSHKPGASGVAGTKEE